MPRNMARMLAACGGIWLGACTGTEPFVPTPTSVRVTPGTVSLTALGATRQLRAAVLDQRGDSIPGASVTWATTDPAVATIDSTGLLVAVGIGGVQARATAASATAVVVGTVDVTVTQLPAVLRKVSGDLQTDTISQTLSGELVVEVNDALDHPIPEVILSYTIMQGGGGVSAMADTSDAMGRASVTWTLGASAGVNSLLVSVAGQATSTTFTAYGIVPGRVPTVEAFAGDSQTGLVGYPVNIPPAVQVRDTGGVLQAGVAVTFSLPEGGGAVAGASVVTDANGVARVGSWSVTVGVNRLYATVTDSGPWLGNPVAFTATGAPAAYHIDVRVLTPMTASQKAAFDHAAAKWESLIFGDIPDVAMSLTAGRCGSRSPAVNETIDDIVIFASIDSIDGPGNILGQAGTCAVRSGSLLPILGSMEFDSADVVVLQSTAQFDLVIEHEMGHVLGFGSIWPGLGLLVGGSTSDPHFIGTQALAAFDGIGGSTYVAGAKVPVEDCCGTGTRNSHWRETVLGHELMTGFINTGANPLSVLSTASMGDLGYEVNYAASDPFSVMAALQAQPGPVLELGNDVLSMPIAVVDPTGRIVRVLPAP
jgi:hypothetical protein